MSMLIDSGSQITCINAKFYQENFGSKDWPKLPVKNCHIYGALGRKIQRVTEQIHIPVQVNECNTHIIALIIPKLVRCCIVGIDTLREWKAIINFSESNIQCIIENKPVVLPFRETFNSHEINIIENKKKIITARYIVVSRLIAVCVKAIARLQRGQG